MKKKANLAYNSGLELILPKQGNAPLLFLEYVAFVSREQKRTVKFRIVDTNYQTNGELDETCFKMKLESEILESAQQMVDYINDNL